MLSSETLAQIAAVLAVIGTVIPHLQALIQQPFWPARWKLRLSIGLAVVSALVVYLGTNGLTFKDPIELVGWLVGAIGAVTIGYRGVWKGTATKLEEATTGVPVKEAPYDENDVEIDPDDLDDEAAEPEVEPPADFDDGAGSSTPTRPDAVTPQHKL